MVGNAVFDYGSTGTSEVSFEGAEGVAANVIDHPEAVIAVNGNVISVSNLSAGTYTLNVTTEVDDNHNSVSKKASVTVNKIDSTLVISDMVFDYGSTGTSEVSFEGAEGVVANVTGHPEAVITVNGKVISVSNLNVGTYTLNVTTVADGNHKSVSKNVLITVKKADSTLVIGNDIVFDFNGASSTNVSFANASGVVASVVGQPDAVINVVGNNITVSGLDAGSYI